MEKTKQPSHFCYCFNPEDNGGEAITLSTSVEQAGTDEALVTQELTLHSYSNWATFQISFYLTPDKLRECADKIESFLADRRPKPPTLKQKALESLTRIQQFQATYQDIEAISSALQTLPDKGEENT
jgi:hypothetical protein